MSLPTFLHAKLGRNLKEEEIKELKEPAGSQRSSAWGLTSTCAFTRSSSFGADLMPAGAQGPFQVISMSGRRPGWQRLECRQRGSVPVMLIAAFSPTKDGGWEAEDPGGQQLGNSQPPPSPLSPGPFISLPSGRAVTVLKGRSFLHYGMPKLKI